MDWEKRKKDMSDKLRYLGYSEKEAKKTANMNYDFIGRFFGFYKKLEIDVYDAYRNKKHREYLNNKINNVLKEEGRLN